MNCHEINPKLHLLADGELMDSEMQAVRGHLAECADCRMLLAALERENEILREAATVQFCEPERLLLLENRLLRRLERPNRWLWAGVTFRKQILAFASALMLIMGVIMHFHGDQSILAHSIAQLQIERSRLDIRFQWNQRLGNISSPRRR
jgi:anti-sigma factor RsiW